MIYVFLDENGEEQLKQIFEENARSYACVYVCTSSVSIILKQWIFSNDNNK